MSGDLDLEQRYRRVLRLLPGYYRAKWEEDMVAAFLDGWLTGDPDEDSVTMEYDRPARQEIVSVVGLAGRLYLGGAGAPRRYFAWGQAVRNAVLGVMLAHAVWGLGELVLFARSRHLIGWLPPPPGGFWPALGYATGYAWIVVFVALVLLDYRTARAIAALVVGADVVAVLHAQLAGTLVSPFASWATAAVIDVAPVLAMAAFHRDAPPVARRPWLLALPAWYLLVSVPVLAAELHGHAAWVPDVAGRCCLLVGLLCLAHAPRAWSGRDGTGVWSLTLMLLAAVAGVYRVISLPLFARDPHLIKVGLVELLILAIAAALVAPDAARSQGAMPAPPAYPRLG
ncbi:MAG TPA: hypothetical protein VHZ33_26560 [Trebonia sp.]|nr:hypothetical protein [Trebonia sp.]